MNLKPLSDRVILKAMEAEEKTKGGIILTGDAKEKPEMAEVVAVAMRLEALPEDKRPSACIGCGKCAKICPQNIDIPRAMKGLAEAVAKLPSWTEICRQREEAAKKSRAE